MTTSAQTHTPWPLPKRKEELRKLLSGEASDKHQQRFQSKVQSLPVHVVPIDLPVFRLANGRTIALQREYITANDKAEGFFSADPDSAEALRAQASLLGKLVRKQQPPLIEFFKKEEQTEPLIIDRSGYVVNGNRRLWAMRELFGEDPETYGRYGHVRVAVLPECTERDVDELEARLQIQPDIKADYTWIDEAMILRDRQKRHGWSTKDLARIHDKSEQGVRESIDCLEHAEQFLREQNRPDAYSTVEKAKYAFIQLRKAREKCSTPAEKDVLGKVVHLLVERSADVGARVYEVIPDVQKYLPRIAEAVAESLEVDAESAEQAPLDGDLAVLAGDTLPGMASDGQLLSAVGVAIHEADDRESLLEVILDQVEAGRAEDEDDKSAKLALRKAKAAKKALEVSLGSLANSDQHAEIAEQINEIQDLSEQILAWISDHAGD